MEKPMLAYAVLEHGENTGGIVFARHAIVARKAGSCEYADGDIGSVSCRRAPWADWCATSGIVHASLMVEHGWRFECHSCGRTIDRDWLDEFDLPSETVIGTQHGRIFCRPHCKCRHDRIDARKSEVGAEFLAAMRDRIRRRLGDVRFTDGDSYSKPRVHVVFDQGWYTVAEAGLPFEFPGMTIGPATAHYHLPHADSHFRRGMGPSPIKVTCYAGDKDVFEAFAKEASHAV